jgi:ABC-2 type transport system ATP-binding protein
VDPAKATPAWHQRIGIVLQDTALEALLTVRESLELYAGYYEAPRPVDEVLELVGLSDRDGARTGRLSGGQKRRLDVGIALVGNPDLLFLDEPTTGFDPEARRHAWQMIAGLRDIGKTVMLTTHYMEEAQFLADRVAVINRGVVVADDAPDRLGDRENLPTRISFQLPTGFDPGAAGQIAGMAVAVEPGEGVPSAVIESDSPTADLNRLTEWAIAGGFELAGLEVRRPSLEDVYLELTSS